MLCYIMLRSIVHIFKSEYKISYIDKERVKIQTFDFGYVATLINQMILNLPLTRVYFPESPLNFNFTVLHVTHILHILRILHILQNLTS